MLDMLLNSVPIEYDPNIVPVMIANNQPLGYIASAMSTAGGQPYIVFARDTLLPNQLWYGATETSNSVIEEWLRIELPAPKTVVRYTLTGHQSWGLIDYALQGSNNGSGWSTLHTLKDRSKEDQKAAVTYHIPNTTPFRFYRIYITKVSLRRGAITRLELYETAS